MYTHDEVNQMAAAAAASGQASSSFEYAAAN
jgi:hypothetical protein